MRARLGSLLVLVLAGSCGPAGPVDATASTGHMSGATSSTTDPSSTDAVTSTTSTAPTSTGGEAGEASSSGGETGEVTSTSGETGEASVTVATTETTAAGTTGESSTGEPTGVVYTAEYYIGQINRITVYRADFDADNCAVIKFSENGGDPNMPVTLPPFWQVEWTHLSQGTESCFGGQPGPVWEEADSVMGMANFDPSMACIIDIDVIATFSQTQPWVPMNIHFMASDLPIEGLC